MKKHLGAMGLVLAAILGGAVALATGDAGTQADESDETTSVEVLGEGDLADRAEILRNMYRRITPQDMPLVQDVGTWPAAWEEFGANWDAAAVNREYGTWVVPVEVSQDAGVTVVKDGAGALLWRGWTDFARPDSADVVLTGGLVAEEEWNAYEGVRDAVESMRETAGGTPALPAMRTALTNGLRFTGHEWTTNDTFRLELAYEIDTNVDIFAYAVAHTSAWVVATWTNDENVVVTDTNLVWHPSGPSFNGMESAWEQRGTVAISNGMAEFWDSGFTEAASRVRFYAAEVAQDTDGDGLNDGQESFVHHTDPTLADSDGDGWGDGMEVALGFDPAMAADVPNVTINGVLYDPSGSDDGKEWIELYSTGPTSLDLGGFRLEVGRNGVWSNTVAFPPGTSIQAWHCLLIGESAVTNADIHATLGIPNAMVGEPSTGVRLVWGGATNGNVADVVFFGRGDEFNSAGLDTTGWLCATSVWCFAGRAAVRRFPGLDSGTDGDWTWMSATDRPGQNSMVVVDSDGDDLSDAEEWTGSQNPCGEPTNPWNADSDGDGLSDYTECVTYQTNPNSWASDGDIWPWMPSGTSVTNWPGSDSWEVVHGHNPTNADENANGIPDTWEWMVSWNSLMNDGDTDGDGISDWDELHQNSNPLDAGDSDAKPYVVHYEATLPGWENGAVTNDIGLRGEVCVRFIGAMPGQGVLVRVTEGNVQEEFTLEWKGADPIATFEGGNPSEWYTSASLKRNSVLVVKDSGLHPDFINTLGGEYTITNFTAALVPDWNFDRQIDAVDRSAIWRGESFRLWLNDDNDDGPIGNDTSNIPGQGDNADASNQAVDGECDLLDFFPVWVDAAEVLENVPGNTSCRVRQIQGALNAAYTDLPTTAASDFLTNKTAVYGPGFDVHPQAAPTFRIPSEGVELAASFANKIVEGKGILMVEGRRASAVPLVFEVLRGGEAVFATELSMYVESVTNMFSWINFRPGSPPNVLLDTELPNVLFIHGANVEVAEEDAWASEIYKRLVRSGASMAFWPVRWEGDLGESWNYHQNASNAFRVASWLGPVLSGGQGRNVILAHSLGTVVAAAAIQNYGGQADKLMMFNSSIPSEAFDPSLFNADTNNHLVHDNWVEYTNACWTARWHELFPQGDARHSLTWRGRFSSLAPICENFYSSGDEVLELYEDAHNPAWYNGFSPSGNWGERYCWHKQELWKGRKSLVAFMGPSDWSGWGFKRNIPLINAWSAAEANAVTDPHVFATNTVFDPTPASITNASATRLETDMHLALGIPALSPATGRTQFVSSVVSSHDLNSPEYKKHIWPRPDDGGLGGRFLHSDIKDVAYLFVYPVFNNIVQLGGLNP